MPLIRICITLTVLLPLTARAATFTKVMHLPIAAQPADANKTLLAEVQESNDLHPDNACASIDDCAKKYRLERFGSGGAHEIIPIRSVTVANEVDGVVFPTLTLSLDAAPTGAGDLSLV